MNIYDKVSQFGLYGLGEGSNRQYNGDVWFVNINHGSAGNTADTGVGESWDLPFSTVNYAISRCSSNAGDVILVAAGHAETIQDTGSVSGTTTDELVVDKAAITIIGMGTGTRRPIFTLSGATDAAMVILSGASNVTIKNLIYVSDLTDVAAAITVDAAADGAIFENCEFRDGSSTKELVIGIKVAANADDVIIRGCRFFGTDTANNASGIKLVGASARVQIYDNFFRGDWETAAIDGVTASGTDILIRDNVVNNLDASAGLCISLHASTTGAVLHNTVHGGKASVIPIAAAGCLVGPNNITRAEGEIALPVNPILGIRVQRAAADIFDGTTTSLFTIAGGRILLTHLSMQNSAGTCNATANNVKFVMNPTTGTNTDLCATLDVALDLINCLYTITGTLGDALIQSGAATDGAVGAGMASQVICDEGVIELSSSGNSVDPRPSVDLWYFPLDDGATVVTA